MLQRLSKYSFDMWDLGMDIEHKLHLGAQNMERNEFVDTLMSLRSKTTSGILKFDDRINCKDVLTQTGVP